MRQNRVYQGRQIRGSWCMKALIHGGRNGVGLPSCWARTGGVTSPSSSNAEPELDVKSGEMGIRGVGPEEACPEDPDLQVHGALVTRRVPTTAARG